MKISLKELYFCGINLFIDNKMEAIDHKKHLPYWKYIDKIVEFEFIGCGSNKFYLSAKNYYNPELGFDFFTLYKIIPTLNKRVIIEYCCKNKNGYFWGSEHKICHMYLLDALELIERDDDGYYSVNFLAKK